ncbi:MAG: flagellar filament capping protein FliD [Rickettsiales bacterium]|nr:flagellar filament capping protein FliD [Rickettsiales bacterium]
MTTINLGNIVGNTISGIASGLDSTKLVEELSALRKRPIDTLNLQIKTNQTKVTEYSSLNTNLNALKNSVNFLRNPTGVLSNFSNAFEYRSANLFSTTLSASSYLSVTADPGAQIGNSKIEIGSIAKTLEQRTGSFNTRSLSATTASSGSYFTAGTFEIGSGVTKEVTGTTLTGFQLASGDYSVEGSATGILTAAGIENFNVVGGSGGLVGLQGSISGITASYDNTANTTTLSFTKNGVVYTSNAITSDTSINAGANTGVASGAVITFTGNSGGVNETSFTLTLDEDIIIDDLQSNANSFATNLNSALSNQKIYQSRRINNFTNADVKAPLTGLTSSNVRFISDNFNTSNGQFGTIRDFQVQYSTGSNGIISVRVGDEIFRASNLGTTLNANLTLESTTSDKKIQINLGDAGVSANISTRENASSLEKALGYAFGTRELVDFTIVEGESLNDIVFNLNQKKSLTGLSASIVQVGDFDFRLSLKSATEGLDNSYQFFDAGGVLTNASITTTQSASNAIFSVDGVEIERSTNTIADVKENVTFTLRNVTPDYGEITADSIDVAINFDADLVTERIVAFLDSYNAFRVYEAKQNERDPATQKYKDTAILGGDTILKSLSDLLSIEINRIVDGTTDSNFRSLADIGITLNDFAGDETTIATNNILNYDESELKNAIANNFEKIREIFELKSTISSSNLVLSKSSNSITLNEFKLDIDTSRAVGQQVKLLNADGTDYLSGGQNVYLSLSAGIISGATGTPVAGLEFIYTGDGTDEISVSITQGIADKIYNIADDYLKDGGILEVTIDEIVASNEDFSSEVISLEDRLEDYVKRLRDQFAALEQAINSANSVLLLLEAQDNVRNARN